MPWRVRRAVDERMRFVRRLADGERMSDVCREFGISRKTGYKFWNRWQKRQEEGLEDLERVPIRVPHRTPEAIQQIVVEAREKHPTWGPRKLRTWLEERQPDVRLPAASTIGLILVRHQLVRARRVRRRTPGYPGSLRPSRRPNEVWGVDFKGQFRLGNGTYCYPLTASDLFSRYLSTCEALSSTQGGPVREVFEETFREQGLPDTIRTDGGSPFASPGLMGLSRLSVWWRRLGITHERIEAGHPEQNGRHERMHRTLKHETTRPAATTLLGQQERFDAFRKTYNEERPHEALGQKPPSTVYQRSVRPYPDRLQEPEYPLHDDVRRVSVSGHVPFGKRNSGVFLSTALSGELVGLRELDDGRWLVSFLDLDLGVVDPSSRHLAALPQRVEAIPSIEASTEDLFVSSGPYAEKPIRNAPSLLNG